MVTTLNRRKEKQRPVQHQSNLNSLTACLNRGVILTSWQLGRALLANPDWVTLVADGRAAELRPFTKNLLDQLV